MLVLAALAAPSVALAEEEAERRPAPDYFVATAFELQAAQAVALACPTLSIDPLAMGRRTEEALSRLTEDGFTPETIETAMEDPTEAIAALQDAFLAEHDLADGASPGTVCAAGRAERAAGSPIGALLVEVTE